MDEVTIVSTYTAILTFLLAAMITWRIRWEERFERNLGDIPSEEGARVTELIQQYAHFVRNISAVSFASAIGLILCLVWLLCFLFGVSPLGGIGVILLTGYIIVLSSVLAFDFWVALRNAQHRAKELDGR